jgi:hypothetical protein
MESLLSNIFMKPRTAFEIKIQKIKDGETTMASFSPMALTVNHANQIAKALELNTSVSSLNISMSNLNDDKFLPIANALLTRSASLVELNVEFSNLSTKSVGALINLMVNKKIESLFIYKNIKMTAEDIEKLHETAKKCGVTINNQNPIARQDPNGYARFLAQSNPTSYDDLITAEKENFTEEKDQFSIPSIRK